MTAGNGGLHSKLLREPGSIRAPYVDEDGRRCIRPEKTRPGFFGIKDPARLIFTKNTTESLNMAMSGFAGRRSCSHHVYGAQFRIPSSETAGGIGRIPYDRQGDRMGRVSAQAVENALTESTSLIVITGASNVSGTIMPFDEIGRK